MNDIEMAVVLPDCARTFVREMEVIVMQWFGMSRLDTKFHAE